MGAVSTSVSTFQGITAALATMASCWLTMATTAWVRGVLTGRVGAAGTHPWGTPAHLLGSLSSERENFACGSKGFQVSSQCGSFSSQYMRITLFLWSVLGLSVLNAICHYAK